MTESNKLIELYNKIETEMQDLAVKATKLEDFIKTDKFKSLSNIQQVLLRIQLQAMDTYYQCLSERLENL